MIDWNVTNSTRVVCKKSWPPWKPQTLSGSSKICILVCHPKPPNPHHRPIKPPTHIFTPFWNSFSLGHNVASNICLFSDLSVEPHEYDDRYLASLLYVNKDRRSLSNIYQRRHVCRPFVDELNLSSTVVTRKEFSCIEEVLIIWIGAFLTFIGILITFNEILITFIGIFCNSWHIRFFCFDFFVSSIVWYSDIIMKFWLH